MSRRRALITEITGPDGSYLAELLLGKGYEVHGTIRRSSIFGTERIDHLYVDSQPQAYREQYEFNGTYLIPVNRHGLGDNCDPATSHMTPALIRGLVDARDRRLNSIGAWRTGNATRAFLFVDDAAREIALAADHYSGAGVDVSQARCLFGFSSEVPLEVDSRSTMGRWEEHGA